MPWEIYIIRSQEKNIEPEPGFEPRTSGFLARRSTTLLKDEVSSLVVNKMADSVMTAPPAKSGIRLKRKI